METTTCDSSAASDHPLVVLNCKAEQWDVSIDSLQFAELMDKEDPIHYIRQEFLFPKCGDLPRVDPDLVNKDEECVYLCGNSLGLMPKRASDRVIRNLDQWAKLAVEGHVHGERPWACADREVTPMMTTLVGAEAGEVVVMNSLTVNQHFLMVSFYQPNEKRHKILLEDGAFPSDHYAVESQIRLRGYDPKKSMMLLKPRKDEYILHIEDVLRIIEDDGDSIALVMLPGVQFRTGQVLDMATITAAAHKKGCIVGFDLAHAAGNIELFLHDWNVDFAVWCCYKYICAGAGAIGAAFVHKRHLSQGVFKLQGWWGHKSSSRFLMTNVMDEEEGAASFRVSNPSGLQCSALEGALELFHLTTMRSLRAKSEQLTAYLDYLLNIKYKDDVLIITPAEPRQRGCQLSLVIKRLPMMKVFKALGSKGVVVDERQPNIIRVTPVHIYNSYVDVFRFATILGEILQQVHGKFLT